jgi:hypothetical protein
VCLAQNDLFALVPELESGIKQPPFDMQRLHKRSTWLGPAGRLPLRTITGLHGIMTLLPLLSVPIVADRF